MSIIKEGMMWPPMDCHRYKMSEHAAWYSGDAEVLANFYAEDRSREFLSLTYTNVNKNTFWRRQIKNLSDFFIHVPIANDLAETSAAFLFGESPLIRFSDAQGQTQQELDTMLVESGLFQKLLEGAEIGSALGGVFIKLCWDTELSKYPIPVVVQPDDAFPEFKFGKLCAFESLSATYADKEQSKVYRLIERYERGKIPYRLYEGSSDRLGNQVDLSTIEETSGLQDEQKVPDALFVVYVPNLLPNRLDRRSPSGRSDLQGIELMMDALDETFSAWMIDIQFARGKIHLPADYLKKNDSGIVTFNMDKNMYIELDADPTALGNNAITVSQFAIRANEFEQTILNLLDRIITSAGYSPQSFGLNISGRAESGTALNVRERKSFATTSKKQAYWEQPIKQLVKLMLLVYNEELGGHIVGDPEGLTVEFCDSVSNNLTEICNSIKMLSDAKAASTETKVRMAHPEWSDEQVLDEVAKIEEAEAIEIPNPDNNPDITQLSQEIDAEEQEEI